MSNKETIYKITRLMLTLYMPRKSPKMFSISKASEEAFDLRSRLIGEWSRPKYPLREAIILPIIKNSRAPKDVPLKMARPP